MDLTKLDWLPYEKRYWYPHMGPADREIWERFITAKPDAFDTCAYDVVVGRGPAEEEIVANGGHPNEVKLYQRKIDVLAATPGILTIIECKPRASTSAIGQIEGYATLFRRDYGYKGTLNLLIITDRLMPEMEFLANNKGVNLIVV